MRTFENLFDWYLPLLYQVFYGLINNRIILWIKIVESEIPVFFIGHLNLDIRLKTLSVDIGSVW